MTGCWEKIRCILAISPIYRPWESKGGCGFYIKGLKMECRFYFFSRTSFYLLWSRRCNRFQVQKCLRSHSTALLLSDYAHASVLFGVCVCMRKSYVTKLFMCCLSSSHLIGQSLLWRIEGQLGDFPERRQWSVKSRGRMRTLPCNG